jgi:hypothetical protein
VIRSSDLEKERASGSERKSGGFGRWAEWRRKQLNASIRTGVTTRKGSGGCGSSRRRQQAETQRARSEEAAATGANRKRWPSRRAERARKSAGEGAKEQARTIDPGMAALRGVAVAGEGKADPSARSRQGDEIQSCGELEGIDPEAGETGFRGAEQRSTRRSRTQCSVRCMPVVSKAGNQITWNHFSFLAPRFRFPQNPVHRFFPVFYHSKSEF